MSFSSMNFNPVLQSITAFPARLQQRVKGMFNLNDPRWGRSDEPKSSGDRP